MTEIQGTTGEVGTMGTMLPFRGKQVRHGGRAVLVVHDAVDGRVESPVLTFRVAGPGIVRGYRWGGVWTTNAGPLGEGLDLFTDDPSSSLAHRQYVTIEVAGRTVYDSRADVPYDQEQWSPTDHHYERNWSYDSDMDDEFA